MKRRRGILWLLAGLVLAALAAGISYYAFQQVVAERASTAEEVTTQTVVVAKQLINERAVIRLADLGTEERPVEEVPSGAIFKTEDAVGRITTRSVQPGQVLLAQNLIESFPSTGVEPADVVTGTVNFSEALGEELVAFALPASDRLSQEGILLPGDHVDLLFSTDVVGEEEGTGGKVSIYAIQDLEVLQVIYQPQPQQEGEGEQKKEEAETEPVLVPKTIIVALEPQDAVVLKYAIDTSSSLDLVLRSQDNERTFDVDAVYINTISDRYRFSAPRPLP
ncbi:MAG: Flp pilus assembly protein CpaB [Anaerolineales bacterium]|nr:MAG: Flp pilus assembly protein CpaB [Anaerolineales bacterium]